MKAITSDAIWHFWAQVSHSSASTLKARWTKAIGQDRRHTMGDSSGGLPVAGGNDAPTIGQPVFAQAPVQHQLVAGRLHQGRRGVKFIQK